jgi:hypothetical protein
MNQQLYLRRLGKLVVPLGESVLPDKFIATAMKNIEYLGYTFSEQLIRIFRTLSIEEFTSIYDKLVEDLKTIVGAHVIFKPMYPHFPQQVMLVSDAELYINAILHYITLALPEYEAIERFPLLDQVNLKVIDAGSEEELYQSIRNLIQANGSISESDKEDIEWAIENVGDLSSIMPEEIPSKENVGFVIGALLKYDRADMKRLQRYVHTATDVLRLAVAMSDGDVSLASNTKFRKFKRVERRLLLGLLDACGNLVEDMLRYKTRWIRLGEILHPAEYKHHYFNCKEAFDILRNDRPFETFGGKLEKALGNQNITGAVDLLKNRAGEFARRLDHLLRLTPHAAGVIDEFQRVVHQVSTPVLLQVTAHFSHRTNRQEMRTFFPKGNIAKVVAVENTLPELDSAICEHVVGICQEELVSRFAELPPLGKVYIDERLKQHFVPFSQRSASKSLRTLVRGSRMKLPEGDTVRFFIWWKEGMVHGNHTGRVDIDLSAVMYDEEWQYVEHISYTNLRSSKYKAAHSGDITSAPDGACEFIDIDIPSVLEFGGRYIMASLNSFTSQAYCDLPECFAGSMMRAFPNSGEAFEPSTVIDKIDLSADTQIAIPVILDLKERTVVWSDIALKSHPNFYNNIEGNQTGMVLMGKAMTSLNKPTLYDLFMLHTRARGERVSRLDEAETVFSLEAGVTPFETEIIMSGYMQ